jgi:hydrogenase maturation protease
MNTLVLALGSPLRGDDGAGLAVLNYLAEMSLPGWITLRDGGTPGFETVLLIQGYRRVIIVDAAQMGLLPGEWRCFEPDTVELGAANLWGTLHNAGLAEVLSLASALGILPPKIIIYGIQPEDIGWEQRLSAAVRTAVLAVGAAILNELEICHHEQDSDNR